MDVTQKTDEEEFVTSRDINASQIPSQQHEPFNSIPPTNSANKIKSDRTLERKDYIARMLAARTSKASIAEKFTGYRIFEIVGLAKKDTASEKLMTDSRPKSPTDAPSSSSSAPEARHSFEEKGLRWNFYAKRQKH